VGTDDGGARWDDAYAQGETTRSWYQVRPTMSLRMIHLAGTRPADAVIDIGGGAAPLVDVLLAEGFSDVTVLDISQAGLRAAQERLGPAARRVRWVHADITRWRPERRYRMWHDRAVFHFLTDRAAQDSYLEALAAGVEPGGHVVIGCFASDGPAQCSGLPVARYSASDLEKVVSPYLTALATDREEHTTPAGVTQPFTWLLGQR
jgi:hypothetical protein